MNTHPLNISKVLLCHYTYTLEGSWGGWWWGGWRIHGVGGWWWCAWWGGWLESSWMGNYMDPPYPGVLGVMGGWA